MTALRPLKIAFLSRWLWEENRRTGGKGTSQELAESVSALGHEVVVLSQSPHAKNLQKSSIGLLETWLSPREIRKGGWTSLRDKIAKFRFKHRKVYTDAFALREFLEKRGSFDLLWAQTEEPDGLVAAIAAQEGAPLPPVVTQIQALRNRFKGNQPVFTDQAALNLAFKYSNRVIANSELIASLITQYYIPKGLTPAQIRAKTTVIYHNLTSNFLLANQTVAASEPEPNRVLFLGALTESKGPFPFLEAIRKCSSRMTLSDVALVGGFTRRDKKFENRWQKELQQTEQALRQNGATGSITALGRISAPEVVEQIQRASVVVVPSLFEPFGRVVPEALALGRPVITTNLVGAARLLELQPNDQAPGLVVPAHDANKLGEAILSILKPGSPFLANARTISSQIRHDFTPRKMAIQMVEEFYKAL